MAETVAFTGCHHCQKPGVAVKVNRAGKAYATCDHCGFKWQHTWQKSSDAHLAAIGGAPAAPAPVPAKPAPVAAAPVAAPTPPVKAPAVQRTATLLG